MLRLSYNTWRRGLFKLCVFPSALCPHPYLVMLNFVHSNDEDYRWAILRNKLPTWLFQVVNLTFIGMCIPSTLLGAHCNTLFHVSCDPKCSTASHGHPNADS